MQDQHNLLGFLCKEDEQWIIKYIKLDWVSRRPLSHIADVIPVHPDDLVNLTYPDKHNIKVEFTILPICEHTKDVYCGNLDCHPTHFGKLITTD